jgi:ketosteroid isomerase-like protein
MKRSGIVSALSVAVCLLLAGVGIGATASDAKTRKLIEDLEMRRFKAIVEADVVTLENLLAPDMTYSHSNGWTQTKSEFINSLRSRELEYREIKPDVLQVRVYGATAVVTGRAHVKAKSKGQDISLELRFLDVYVKRKGKWQMVAWQSARLAT